MLVYFLPRSTQTVKSGSSKLAETMSRKDELLFLNLMLIPCICGNRLTFRNKIIKKIVLSNISHCKGIMMVPLMRHP
jgi:hypothetical protein